MNNEFADLENSHTEVRPSAQASSSHGAFRLLVTEGRDVGLSLTFDDDEPSPILIGQSPACALRLSDPQVSRRHAELEITGDYLRISDLDSTNGTFSCGLQIREALLRGGELLQLGSTVLRVERRMVSSVSESALKTRFGPVIGSSRPMQRLYPLIERLAATDVPLVIEGETGTGKEALTEAIHEASPRAAQPFVVFDCTTVPTHLMESELFGHERGSFTGAVSSRKGVFEQAHRGTLLIDEIGDLDISLQPKLLRAIERSEIRRVGSERFVRVNVRVIAATRRNLDQMVQKGQFRDDLFYRLAVGRIELPPLRRRIGDIAVLVRHFWKELGGDENAIPQEVLHRWLDAPWPGNIRQLRNAVARELALGELATSSACDGSDANDYSAETISAAASESQNIPDYISEVIAQKLPLPVARLRVVREFEQRYIARVLEEHGGNVMRAAKASGIARRYFQILRGGKRRKE